MFGSERKVDETEHRERESDGGGAASKTGVDDEELQAVDAEGLDSEFPPHHVDDGNDGRVIGRCLCL